MAHLALALTNRPMLGEWLRHAFEYLRDWHLDAVIPPSRFVIESVLADGRVEAVLIDVEGAVSQTLGLAAFVAEQYPLLRLLAVSCCGRDRDDLVLGLLRTGVAGYLICDGPTGRLAVDLGRALNGIPVWPADSVARLAPSLARQGIGITARDLQFIRLLARGRGYQEIAEIVGFSPHTVRRRLGVFFRQRQIPNKTALIAWAAQQGLLGEEPSELPGDPAVESLLVEGWYGELASEPLSEISAGSGSVQ